MAHKQTRLSIETRGQGLYEFTRELEAFCLESKIGVGVVTVFCRHTSASLTIQENADPDVIADLNAYFREIVPEDPSIYHHTAEGPDDMPAHIRSALTDVSLSIPVSDGRPTLGTWQGIYLFEHRTRAHSRAVVLHISGE